MENDPLFDLENQEDSQDDLMTALSKGPLAVNLGDCSEIWEKVGGFSIKLSAEEVKSLNIDPRYIAKKPSSKSENKSKSPPRESKSNPSNGESKTPVKSKTSPESDAEREIFPWLSPSNSSETPRGPNFFANSGSSPLGTSPVQPPVKSLTPSNLVCEEKVEEDSLHRVEKCVELSIASVKNGPVIRSIETEVDSLMMRKEGVLDVWPFSIKALSIRNFCHEKDITRLDLKKSLSLEYFERLKMKTPSSDIVISTYCDDVLIGGPEDQVAFLSKLLHEKWKSNYENILFDRLFELDCDYDDL